MATYEDAWQQFRQLSPADQGRFLDAARQMVRLNAANLTSGAKVEFTNTKTGAKIRGEFIRMKTKNAEVRSTQDAQGRDLGRPVFWNVPPEHLRLAAT